MEALRQKKSELRQKAVKEHEEAVQAILDSCPPLESCSVCHESSQLMHARCMQKGCDVALCSTCLQAGLVGAFLPVLTICTRQPKQRQKVSWKCHKCTLADGLRKPASIREFESHIRLSAMDYKRDPPSYMLTHSS